MKQVGPQAVPLTLGVVTSPTLHSEDGAWWWSGSEWLPARSPDGKWWFDGQVWRRAKRWRSFVVGVLAVVLAYVPPTWYGQRVVGANIGSGALWLLGLAAMLTGTIGYITTTRKTGARPARRVLIMITVCWAVAVGVLLLGAAMYSR